MAHDHHRHDHNHTHTHGHAKPSVGAAFAIGTLMNLIFVAIEAGYGLISHSMALMADAGHNLSDVLGLALAWGASLLAQKAPTRLRTYGFRNTTILASLINALALLFVTGGIVWESVRRFAEPEPIAGRTVIFVALAGVLVNGVSAALFAAGSKEDLNVRGAFLHLAADAALSLGVAVAGAVMMYTGWSWLDPAVSIAVSLLILWSTWSLLRSSANLLLHAVPEGIDPDQVAAYLQGLPGVTELHDLHIWAMSTTETALTAHVVMGPAAPPTRFLSDVCHELHERFGIAHATIQVEPSACVEPCRLSPKGAL